MATEALGWLGVPLVIAAGTMRGGTPFLFVSLGECLTEKSGKINLGLEGTLLMGAMSAYGISYLTGSPWHREVRSQNSEFRISSNLTTQ